MKTKRRKVGRHQPTDLPIQEEGEEGGKEIGLLSTRKEAVVVVVVQL